uniref:tRNA epoxyqueuosine(34) reductase QueG n=1 Tax=candidate division WOR-3 bacterium TaxID=2052148 RepID=A0A7C2K636_UNCW3
MEYRIIPLPDLTREIAFYEKWIEMGYNGEMTYLKRTLDKRKTFPEGARSILVVRAFYNDIQWDEINTGGKALISKYAIRADYHTVIKNFIADFLAELEIKHKGLQYKVFVDSSPVLEKPIARFAGFGIIGYNTLLLDSEWGSYFHIGGAFLSRDLAEFVEILKDNPCLGCNLCVESCPTGALIKPGVLDASRCISYLTVEYKGVIPRELAVKMQNWVFGCDVCQEVCPLNRKKKYLKVHSMCREELIAPPIESLLSLEEKDFLKLFDETPVLRTGYVRFLRNVIVAAYNTGYLYLLYNMYKRGKLQQERLWMLQIDEMGGLNEP